MDTPEVIRQRITEVDAILRTGATSVDIDGLKVTYNFEELRRERKELAKLLPGSNVRRAVAYANRLG